MHNVGFFAAKSAVNYNKMIVQRLCFDYLITHGNLSSKTVNNRCRRPGRNRFIDTSLVLAICNPLCVANVRTRTEPS